MQASQLQANSIQPLAYGFIAMLVFGIIGIGVVNAAANR